MTSTVQFDTFQPPSGGTPFTTRGVAKAWANLNGTGTIDIRGHENVSSLSDGGIGLYTVNFTNSFTAADYFAAALTSGDGLAASYIYEANGPTGRANATTGSIRMQIVDNTGTVRDRASVNMGINGDLT